MLYIEDVEYRNEKQNLVEVSEHICMNDKLEIFYILITSPLSSAAFYDYERETEFLSDIFV